MTTPNSTIAKPIAPLWRDVGTCVEVFKAALSREDQPPDLAGFLPDTGHPLYRAILRELVRLDLAHGWQRGKPLALEAYRSRFPDLFQDPDSLAQITFEDYQLRRQAGENPSPTEYQQRFKVSLTSWPKVFPNKAVPAEQATVPALHLQDKGQPQLRSLTGSCHENDPVAKSHCFQELFAPCVLNDAAALESWWTSSTGHLEHSQFFRDLHQRDQDAALRPSKAGAILPEVGQDFLGFHLLEQLGQGSFGRVFLAQQGELANRPVALKVVVNLLGESQTLAQLQHTNIVPIYSVHSAPPFSAVCMPYFGSTTLAHVLGELIQKPSLPNSGKCLVSTIKDHERMTRKESELDSGVPATLPCPSHEKTRIAPGQSSAQGAKPPHHTSADQATLEKLPYVDSILWLAMRLADGLAHAHERGILHLDLKPANILLTDACQPMLLDFNLAQDTKLRGEAIAQVGGTLLYMSPEQIGAFSGGQHSVDARSDLYSLGLILFELLTGRQLCPVPPGPPWEAAAKLRESRLQPPLTLRRWNKAISPAVESIVRKCLEPDLTRRYQTALELKEDLQLQLQHQPLKNARNPSLCEGVRKFRRRHPHLTSLTSVILVACLLLVGLASLLVVRGEQLARLEAKDSLAIFQDHFQTVQYLLNARTASESIDEGLNHSQVALDQYQVLSNPAWRTLPNARYLPQEDRVRLTEDVGQLLLMQARALILKGTRTTEQTRQDEHLEKSLRLCKLAESCWPADRVPRALWEQQVELQRLLNKEDEVQRLRTLAQQTPLRTGRDYYLVAFLQADQGHFREAQSMLREATRLDPQDFNACFLQGICHDQQAQYHAAIACYRTCIALRPKSPWPYFNRGLASRRLHDLEQANMDFDQVIRLQPDFVKAYIERALTRESLGKIALAIEDLTQALDLQSDLSAVYFLRARVRQKAGDKEGSLRDYAEGFRREPADEQGWIARGNARLLADPEKALGDYDKALAMNPRSLAALQNKAHVLSKYFKRTEDAVGVLDQAVKLYPDEVRHRAGRGVLLARLGKRDAALKDAEASLALDGSPANHYQVAGIYALTSQQQVKDRQEAFRLLSAALRKGFGFEFLESDRDLDPIRDVPEFRKLVEAARALHPSSSDKKH